VILDGLSAGEKVIVDNLLKVRPGMPVSPQLPGAQPAQGAAPQSTSDEQSQTK
jgi:membrane fusion protein (multidrug efflux system)